MCPSQDACCLCQELRSQEEGEQGQEAGAEKEISQLLGVSVMEPEPVAGQAGHTDTLQQPGAHSGYSPVFGAHILTTFTSFKYNNVKLLNF